MAYATQIGHSFAQQQTRQTLASASYGDIAGISIADGDLTDGSKYLIIATSQIDCNSTSFNCFIQVVHGSTAFADSEYSYESPTATTSRKQQYFWFTVWTAVAGEGIKMQHKGTSTGIVGNDQITLSAINLSDLTENTDWFYDAETADATLAASYGTTGSVAITFTPNGSDDWLVLGGSRIDPTSITVPQKTRITVSGGTTDTGVEHIREAEDATNDRMVHTLAKVYENMPNSSTTFDIDTESSDGTGTRTDMQIFALNLNKFKNNAFQYTSGEINLDTTNSLATSTNVATATLDPNTTTDTLMLGFFIYDANSAEDIKARMQLDNTDYIPSQTSDNYQILLSDDNTDELPWVMVAINATSDASHTLDVDATKATTARPVEDRLALLLNMELAQAFTQNLSDGAKAGETFEAVESSGSAFTENLSDGAKAGDTLTKVLDAARNLTDGAKAGDTLSTVGTFERTLTDGAKAGDTLTTSQAISYTEDLDDGAIAGDTLTTVSERIMVLTDGAKAGDSVTTILDAIRSMTDGAIVGETFEANLMIEFTQNLSDGAKAGDTISTALSGEIIQNLSDGAKAGEIFEVFIECDVTCEVTLVDGAIAGDTLSSNAIEVIPRGNAIKLYLNTPTETRLGGVFVFTCPAGEWAYGITSNGTLLCADPTP